MLFGENGPYREGTPDCDLVFSFSPDWSLTLIAESCGYSDCDWDLVGPPFASFTSYFFGDFYTFVLLYDFICCESVSGILKLFGDLDFSSTCLWLLYGEATLSESR